MAQLSDLTFHSLIAIGILVAFLLLTRVVKAFLSFLGRKVFARTETLLDDRILEVVLANVRYAMLVAGLFVALREISKGTSPAETTILQLLEYSNAAVYVLGIAVLIKIVAGVLREIISWYIERASSEGVSGLKLTLGPLTTKLVNVLVGLVAVIIILDHFGVNIGSLLVSLGVGSLAVALAAQDTLANMIAGFVVLIDRPFRVGDRVEIATGVTGDVMTIGLRSTRLLNFDNNVIIIPNADLVKSRIVNQAFPHSQTRITLRFDVMYGTDLSKLRAILLGLAKANPDIVTDPEPKVLLTGITESSVQVTLIVHARDYRQAGGAESLLREQAYETFLKKKISMPAARHIIKMSGRHPSGMEDA
jgi:MscS family membrane protein